MTKKQVGKEKNFGDKQTSNGFQKENHGFHISMNDPKALLLNKLKKGKLEGATFQDAINNLAKLLYDSRFEQPETRQVILPLLDAALKNDWVSGPSFTWAFNLARLWHAQPNCQGPPKPLLPREPTAEKIAATKEVDAEAERLREEERQAKVRAEAAERLRKSAFLNDEARQVYFAARKAGKFIIYQVPSGDFVSEDGETIGKGWTDLMFKYGSPVVVWIKSAPEKNCTLAESPEDLKWLKPEAKHDTDEIKPWRTREETNRLMGISPEEAAELHKPQKFDGPVPPIGYGVIVPHGAAVTNQLATFMRTRTVSFVETGRNAQDALTGTVTIKSALGSKTFEGVRKIEATKWIEGGLLDSQIPVGMRDAYTMMLLNIQTSVGVRSERDPWDGASARLWGRPAERKVRPSYDISQTGLAAEYERQRRRGGFDL